MAELKPCVCGSENWCVWYCCTPDNGDCVSEYPCRHKVEPPKPKTNADHIRSMTDEELAKFSAYQMSRGDCWGCPWFWPCDYEKETCTKFFLDWLKQPYGGDT